jgi:hypothetical protein
VSTDIFVNLLGGGSSQFTGGIDRASQSLTSFAAKADRAIKVTQALFAAGAATTFITKLASAGDAIAKMSRELGIASSRMLELDTAAERLSGATPEEMNSALERMTRAIGDADRGLGRAKASLDALNISANKLVKLNAADQFLVITDALNKVTNESERASLAYGIFGDKSTKLLNTIGAGRGEIEKVADSTRKLIAGIDDNALSRIEAFNDAWGDVFLSLKGLGISVVSAFAGILTKLAKVLTDYVIPAVKALSTLVLLPIKGLEALIVLLSGDGLDAAAAIANQALLDLAKAFGYVEPEAAKTAATLESVTVVAKKMGLEIRAAMSPEELDKFVETLEGDVLPATDKFAEQVRKINQAYQAGLIGDETFNAGVVKAQNDFLAESKKTANDWVKAWQDAAGRFASGVGDAVADVFFQTSSAADAAKKLVQDLTRQVISSMVEIGVRRAIQFATAQSQQAAATSATVASNATIAASAAPAAAGVSLATAGANSIPAIAGIAATIAATALIAGYRAEGGVVEAGRAYRVGERGAEYFVPNQDGSIVPAGSGGVMVNVNIDARSSNLTGGQINALRRMVSNDALNAFQSVMTSRGRRVF